MADYGGDWHGILSANIIDPEKDEHRRFLEAIQGNILRGHGRNFSALYFLSFDVDKEDKEKARKARQFIQDFSKYVTSALEQYEQSEAFARLYDDKDVYNYYDRRRDKAYRESLRGKLFASFFLTWAGYRALWLPESSRPRDSKFKAGMEKSKLKDPQRSRWQVPYKEKGKIHAMVLLADDDEEYLKEEEGRIFGGIFDFGKVVGVERGLAMRIQDKEGVDHTVEHFGFVDGRSQPSFLKGGGRPQKKYNPRARPGLVLRSDPLGGFGSYMVFRKLQQHVGRFEDMIARLSYDSMADNPIGIEARNLLGRIATLAKKLTKKRPRPSLLATLAKKLPGRNVADLARLLGGMKINQQMATKLAGQLAELANGTARLAEQVAELKRREEEAGARVIGRRANGIPLAPYSDRSKKNVPNDFNYSGAGGNLCPPQAHIRRMNPRSHGSREAYLTPGGDHRIVRRGITYGERDWGLGERDLLAAGFGLAHLPPVADKKPDGSTNEVGLLFMCYQGDIGEQFERLQKRANGKRDPIIGQAAKSLVQLKGGQYFFAPSMSFLKNVGELQVYEKPEDQ